MKAARKEKAKHLKKELNIAIFCLSSLIRSAKGIISGEWIEDGPLLPAEFARIAKNGSLTLVLYGDAAKVQIPWAKTRIATLEETITSLSKREGTTEDNIGFYSSKDDRSRCKTAPQILPSIIEWTREHKLDAVVWNELASNFKEEMRTLLEEKNKAALEKRGQKEGEEEIELYGEADSDFNEDNVLSYIEDLLALERNNARNYFLKTPDQIDTRIRRLVRIELGWRSITEYRNGIWLDEFTFIMCDDVEIKLVNRALGNPSGNTEEAPMLILTNAVEMTMDKNGKILGLERHNKFGLWMDAVTKTMKERDIKLSSTS